MQIVALDTYAAGYGGCSFEALDALGRLTLYERTSEEEFEARVSQAEALIVNKVILGAERLAQLEQLRYIGVSATGTNNVDLEAAKAQGIAVTNVPGYSTDAVAQMVFSYFLHYSTRVHEYDAAVKASAWVNSPDFCFHRNPTVELFGKTLLILGLGAIGRRVQEIAKTFGMNVIVAALPGRTYDADSSRVSLEKALPEADFVSFHCPLTAETKHLLNDSFVRSLKPSAVVVNTARGDVVDENAVASGLKRGEFAYFYTDVLSKEPPDAKNPLLSAPNVCFTPHIAWASVEARARLIQEVAENLKDFLEGGNRNRIV